MEQVEVDLAVRSMLLTDAQRVIDDGVSVLHSRGGIDDNQQFAYDVSHAASSIAIARACHEYGRVGPVESSIANSFLALTFRDLGTRIMGHEDTWAIDPAWFARFSSFVSNFGSPHNLASLAETTGTRQLDEDYEIARDVLHRFAVEEIRPHAERIHREDGDIPESIISGLASLGIFGLSVPEEFGGIATGDDADFVRMVVATEELSWGGFSIGGSLVTRPEILIRALVSGGTSDQKKVWLPLLATGEALIAVAVTEPDFGSDVAGILTSATRTSGGWLVNGTKTWCTFAARANVLMLLARTSPDRSLGHRGLSLFIVEKPIGESGGFRFSQNANEEGREDPNGHLEGRPIDTIGYRGMHSYELSFDNWFVPDANLIGGDEHLNQGFYLQMAGFENGRLQTAARAVGLMQAAYEAALLYARERRVFGKSLIEYELTRVKLGTMTTVIQASRQYIMSVAQAMAKGEGALPAAMAKAYICRMAEWVTREAMQIHGGMGYAEEYSVSRYFVDARVLSIFEGTDETLCLKVIASRLLNQRHEP